MRPADNMVPNTHVYCIAFANSCLFLHILCYLLQPIYPLLPLTSRKVIPYDDTSGGQETNMKDAASTELPSISRPEIVAPIYGRPVSIPDNVAIDKGFAGNSVLARGR